MKQIILIFIVIGLFSCSKNEKMTPQTRDAQSIVKYAIGFDINEYSTYRELVINSPNSKVKTSYVFVKKFKKFASLSDKQVFYKPIERIVVTSTTHIPMLELLHEERSVIGFPNTKYISSEVTRKLITKGHIKELGKEQSINTELLLELQPELVVGFSEGTNKKMYSNIKKAGIPVMINNDWLEKTPLGRAEWIKFFGVLYGKDKEADSIFKNIEKAYLNAKKIALKAKNTPTIVSGGMYMDTWNLPAGQSFGAQFLKDANVNYLWEDSKGNGSLSLSFESVFDKAKDADIWIQPSFFKTYSNLKNANLHYAQFTAFKNRQVYNFVNKKGKTGGMLFYELAPIQPHIVLQDIIKITHPELLPNYVPFYLEELE